MTDDRMALLELVEKGADADLVRDMLAFAAERIMEAETEVAAGAAKGVRTPLREAYRNGYRERDWDTRAGRIELAWLWLRHQPGSALARWFHERVAGAKGRMRRIMLVAMARKLIVSLWRYVTTGTAPEGAVLKA